METCDVFVTVASWEDRFVYGMERIIPRYRPRLVLMYHLDQYADRSAAHRSSVKSLCDKEGVPVEEKCLGWSDPVANWSVLKRRVAELAGNNAVLDITTMPREVIWYAMWLLQWRGMSVRYIYHRPREYNSEWLSRDPGSPRLVVKMSGESRLGARTALLVAAGYDPERTIQLMHFFEPERTLLGLQYSEGDEQNEQRMKLHAERCSQHGRVETFQINAFAGDCGEAAIAGMVRDCGEASNTIMSSLGPKLSAVALYRVHRANPHIGLAYAPSHEYNLEYSKGIGTSHEGIV